MITVYAAPPWKISSNLIDRSYEYYLLRLIRFKSIDGAPVDSSRRPTDLVQEHLRRLYKWMFGFNKQLRLAGSSILK
ncbi:hypothetical protein L6452_29915 [Arctium lappa]|uniref:Uncharacterized protein n=1 Tax=Arctium lappa TaxID=4217 RepID=A0ACB8ZLW5_ARCLA|nr:hypothetical protein L6452_29915 [Arctium lappa]